MVKWVITKIRAYFKPNIGMKRGETREEFLADVARRNRLHREAVYRANAKMRAKWEGKWVEQYEKERKSIL